MSNNRSTKRGGKPTDKKTGTVIKLSTAGKAVLDHLDAVEIASQHIELAEYRTPYQKALRAARKRLGEDQGTLDMLEHIRAEQGLDPLKPFRDVCRPTDTDPKDLIRVLLEAGWLDSPLNLSKNTKDTRYRFTIGDERVAKFKRGARSDANHR